MQTTERHHATTVAGDSRTALGFDAETAGLRVVGRAVGGDDTTAYHLGDHTRTGTSERGYDAPAGGGTNG